MRANTVATLAIALSALALPTLAQDQSRLDDFDADRLNARQILIEFEYQGGACEEVGEVTLGDVAEGTIDVTLKLAATSEVCTMQMVEHDIKEAIAAGPEVTKVSVILLGIDGQTIGRDTTAVDED